MKFNMKEFWKYFIKNIKIVISDLKSKDKEKRRKQIPNTLTLIRGFLAPITIIPAVLNKNIYLAFVLIALCGLTDCFDGWYARNYNAQSEFGADLDAICDKLFVLTLTFPLAFEYTSWIVLILVLELIISIINSHYRLKGIDARSSLIGKAKTVVLDCSIALCYFDYIIHIQDLAITIVTVMTNIMQFITIIDYILKYRKERINEVQTENI
ncbi:MAG: CDP-alcohol phosphatidyltransferase family protein [Clostridia bacterium]|nr:CDP-alcohol phosphatidyltransferase family protein [Clostridia bacterium]